MQIISSQHYLDDEIVQQKLESRDFEVTLSPEFEFDGLRIAVVLDGHHSLAAAKLAGVKPEFIEATKQTNDIIGLLEATDEHEANPESFLEAAWVDGDYYDVETGMDVW